MQLSFSMQGNYDMVNLTTQVADFVKKEKIQDGAVVVFAKHTTVGLTLMEWEEGTKQDVIEALEKIAHQEGEYHHAKWNDGNGAGHVKSALFPPSLIIPIANGELDLGTWQNIILIDFDVRPREREVVLKLMS